MKKWITGIFVLAVITAVTLLWWKPAVTWLYIARSNMQHPQELSFAQLFCARILTNDAPTAEWLSTVIDRSQNGDKTNYFYFLKVHFTECQTSMANLRHAKIWVFAEEATNALAYFYYQRQAPCLYLVIDKLQPDNWKVRASFPLNNCLFDPDVNKDGLVNQKDVDSARKLTR